MPSKQVCLIQLNVAVLMWGGTAMFAKGIALPVWQIICLRSLIGAGAIFLMLLATRSSLKVNHPGHYGVMATLGLLLCFHWLTYFQALKVSSAAVAILALHTYPVFTALVEPLAFKEKLRKSDLVLALIVFAGILVMTPRLSLSNTTTQGIVLGIVSGLFFMVRNLMTRKYVQQYSSSVLMFWQMLVSGAVLVPWLLSGLLTGEKGDWPPHTGSLILLLGVIFTAIPQTLYAASFKALSAKTVGIIATLLPFYGAFFGYLIHHEELALRTVAGGMIILVCIVFETIRSMRPVKT